MELNLTRRGALGLAAGTAVAAGLAACGGGAGNDSAKVQNTQKLSI